MEWKVIIGQVCLTAIAVTMVVQNINHGLLYACIGALAASVGFPAIVETAKAKS